MEKTDFKSVGKRSLDQIVDVVPGIYSEQDNYRSVWDVWLHAIHHASAIGEEVRKYKPGKKLLDEIADFSMWLFTFTNKIQGPFDKNLKDGNIRIGELTVRTEKKFSEIIWNKYPGVCPVCFWRRSNSSETDAKVEKPCDCLIYNVEDRDKTEGSDKEDEEEAKERKRERVKKLREYANSHLKDKPTTIDEWQERFRELYEANLRQLSLVDIGFHLLEEVGEVSDAILRMYSYKKEFKDYPRWNQIWMEEEIADVFSWLLTLVNSLQIIPQITKEFLKYLGANNIIKFEENRIMLSKIIWKRYGSDENKDFRCQECKKLPCECTLLLVGENIDYDVFLKHVGNDPLA